MWAQPQNNKLRGAVDAWLQSSQLPTRRGIVGILCFLLLHPHHRTTDTNSSKAPTFSFGGRAPAVAVCVACVVVESVACAFVVLAVMVVFAPILALVGFAGGVGSAVAVFAVAPVVAILGFMGVPIITPVVGFAASVASAVVSLTVAPILGLVGFSSTGVVAGSMAAGFQASVGNVAAGTLFALAQSMTMGGALPAVGIVIKGTPAGLMLQFYGPAFVFVKFNVKRQAMKCAHALSDVWFSPSGAYNKLMIYSAFATHKCFRTCNSKPTLARLGFHLTVAFQHIAVSSIFSATSLLSTKDSNFEFACTSASEDVLQGVEMGRSTACVAWAVVGIAAVIAVCALVGIAIIVACAAAVIVVAPIVAPVVAPVVGMVVSVAGVTGGFALAVMDAVLGTFGFTAALPGASFLGTFMCAELGAVVAGSLVALARSVVTGVVKLLGAVIDGSAGAAVAMKRFFAK
ncbi:hypothetical protein CCMSSC00406_0003900 [Pleurotus cornucopiae]|uniref:Uncharacterized protein n=1 Tax=Pleurotus cornucopiae TaxID=5321 RepID=A0ACB7IRP4_PLECO|nr:hypothetical protein CCMSSC00406_0003900 [Pleurotus cornucopiae]